MADLQALVDSLCTIGADDAITVVTSVLQARPELAPPVVNFAVPDLTYPPSKALIERRSTGYIKHFNEMKGFGFIACEELHKTFGSDVFLHHSQLGGFGPGQEVSFAVMLNKENKPQAYDLMPPSAKGKGLKGKGKGNGWSDKGGWDMSWDMSWEKGGKGAWGGEKGWAGDGWGGDKGWGADWSAKGASKGEGKRKGAPDESGGALGQFEGVIKSFSPTNGYGFIECPDIKSQYGFDVFLHSAQLASFEVGSQVAFTAFLNNQGKPGAKDLHAPGGAKRQKLGEGYA